MHVKDLHGASFGAVVGDSKDEFRCCGIHHKKWILTSGLALCSYASFFDTVMNTECWRSKSKLTNRWGLRDDNFVEVLKERLKHDEFKVLLYRSDRSKNSFIDNKTSKTYPELGHQNQDLLDSNVAYVSTIFRSHAINQYVVDNFNDWHLCSQLDKFVDISPDVLQTLLSIFVLFRIGEVEDNSNNENPLMYFFNLCDNESIHRGQNIIVESSPFGVPQLYNSWSRGIVSNSTGHSDCLFFTDTRLVIGCIGAPVYRYTHGRKGALLGMILNPLLWKLGEWAGFNIAVNLRVVLSEVVFGKIPIIKDSLKNDLGHGNIIKFLDKSVVLVRCDSSWGSGVIVNNKLGIIITCAHVVKYKPGKVLVSCEDFTTEANVIYTNRLGEVFDVAVLQTEPLENLNTLPLSFSMPLKGDTVYCIGFPMMDTGHATISKGVISNVNPDVAIQTTCCVQAGASGGAVINSSGCLVGIPVSNMSCSKTRALFPHCNLVIPSTTFSQSLMEYFKTNDASCLAGISSKNPVAIKEWSFQDYKCKI